jgi:hypothetical protein
LKISSPVSKLRARFSRPCKLQAAIAALGPAEMRVSKSQIAFRRRKTFAWAWVPGRYLGRGHAPWS